MINVGLGDLTALTQPARMTGQRGADAVPFDSISRSYFLMRLLVGFLGLALPAALLLGERFLLVEEIQTRGSLSAYYHSGMRDVFVGILAVVGILLVTYKISELNRDNALSIVAGIAAIGVAIFPTGIPDGMDAGLTPLQNRLGEDATRNVHYGCAAVFIVCLGFLCRDFARRERGRTQERIGRNARRSPEFWYRFHMSMAGLIGAGVVFIVLTQWWNILDDHSILIGESVVTAAFGLSWLLKSWNRDVLPKVSRT